MTGNFKGELDQLLRYTDRLRQEIAAIEQLMDETQQYDNTGLQLDAIVAATDEATNTIMNAMEKNEAAVSKLREQIDNADQLALLDVISNAGSEVFEACSFQDITGQRVNKVIKSISYMEARVNSLIEIWGKSYLANVKVETGESMTEDEKLLSGPQLKDEGLSQDDIDSLFD